MSDDFKWLDFMPPIPLKAGIPMIHRCGEDWSKRTTVSYQPDIYSWICDIGGTTPNYRVNLSEQVGFDYALELCKKINPWFAIHSSGPDAKLRIAKFLAEHSERILFERWNS